MRRLAVIAVLVVAGGVPAGCDWAHEVGGTINPDSLSLADRCANIMKLAMPFADIAITSRTSQNAGIDVITAQAEGTRTNLPKDDDKDVALAAECRFDDTVLTGFHWTKGGPPPHGGAAQ